MYLDKIIERISILISYFDRCGRSKFIFIWVIDRGGVGGIEWVKDERKVLRK